MIPVRQRIEQFFESMGRWIFCNRYKTLIGMLIFTTPFVVALGSITVDTTDEGFFSENDPVLVGYNAFRAEFGTDDYFIISLEPPDIFAPEFLRRLAALHAELEEKVPYVEEVTSLVNARDTRGEGDTLVVGELLDDWPETREDIEALRQRVVSNPLYTGMLVSADGSMTTISIKARAYMVPEGEDALLGFDDDTGAEQGELVLMDSAKDIEMVDAIEAIVARYRAEDFPIRLGGSPLVVARLNAAMINTLKTFTPLSLLMLLFFGFLMFRRVSGVVYPFVVVVLSLCVSIGIMSFIKMPITLVTQIMPTFLLVVGMGDSVHILSVFYMKFEETGEREGSVAYALGHSGLAVFMTSLTTAAGLSSFIFADVKPIVDMGMIAPVGVMVAFVYTVVLLPALLAIFPVRRKGTVGAGGTGVVMDRVLAWIARVSCQRAGIVLFIGLMVLLVSGVGVSKIRFGHNTLKWFHKANPVRVDTEALDSKLAGTVPLEVVLDTGRVEGLYDPGFLRRLDESASYLEGLSVGIARIGKAVSIASVVKEINRALNENAEEAYALPDSRELIAQELLLFEGSGSDDLADFADSEFQKARLTMIAPFADAVLYRELLGKVRAHLDSVFPDAEIAVTGIMPLFINMISNTISTMTKSYAIALVVITAMMMILIGRVSIGMLSMVPNLLPILAVLGIMGWWDIPMDFSNVLVGSIAIGLVVDDTIHFFHNFRRYFEQTGDVERAVHLTLHTTGRAIAITSAILASGFFIFMFAEMRNTFYYGLLSGSAVMLALVCDFFLTPALMTLVHGRSMRRLV